MLRSVKVVGTFSMLILITALGAGCATTGQLEEVRQEAQAAQSTANDAKRTADSALNTANQALALAEDADARSRSTEEALNRMFRRSMRK